MEQTPYNLSMKTETNAKPWCEANCITPIQTKVPRNCRLISLTSVICKLTKSFIRDATLIIGLLTQNVFTNEQQGVPSRNYSTQVLEAV